MPTPRLLIISGWGFPPATWDRTVRCLEPAYDCRVLDVANLLRACHAGDPGRCIADTIRRELDPRRICYLGGWSLGGMLALQCAPHLAREVRGLLLMASTPQFCQSNEQHWGVSPAKVRAMRNGLRRKPATVLESFYREAASPDESAWERYRPNIPEALANLDGLRHGLDYLLGANLHRLPLNAGLPVMLVHGRDDVIVPLTGSRSLAFQLQPSRLDTIGRAGHDLPLRHPDVVGAAADRLQSLCL